MGSTKTMIAIAWLCSMALVGCAVPPGPSAEASVPAGAGVGAGIAEQQIALDFANAIVQLKELPPADTVLRFPRGDGPAPVLDALRAMLADAGYAVQRVSSGAEGVVRHRAEPERGEPGARRHEVQIGDVGLRRVYRATDGDRVRPISALFVKGADPEAIRMVDEQLFGIEAPADGPDAPPDEKVLPAIARELLARNDHLTGDTASGPGAEAVRTVARAGEGGTAGDATLSLEPVRNVRELGGSNFADVLGARELVVEHVVGFERGSDRLDRDDVVLIDDVLARFDPETDLIAVTGYSSGGGAGVDRNRDMALRRAKRIKSALTAVGVPHERVLIEGYWSDAIEPDADVPGRAAIMRLSRRTS